MPKVVNLRQDRSFIRSNFDGYKLSLDPLPLLAQELTAIPHNAVPNDEQYSLLHAELFSLQNLLLADPWERNMTYHVNCLGEVVRSLYDINTGRPKDLVVVFRLAKKFKSEKMRIKGDYNYSLRFISEKYCVLCDGINELLLLDTGDRLKIAEWKLVAATNINSHDDRNFLIYDCRLDFIKEQKQISCALGHIRRVEAEGAASCVHLLQVLVTKWVCDLASDMWKFCVVDTLEGRGSIYYCAFEPRAESLVISSNRDFSFSSQLKSPVPLEDLKKPPKLHDESVEVGGFTWTQSEDDIVVKFDVREGKAQSNYNIQCTNKRLTIKCDEESLFDADLNDCVDQDLTTWTVENNYLQVTLIKATSTIHWPALLAAGVGPKENCEGGSQTCLPVAQQPIVNLEAPIEDCDFPIADMEDEIKIVRFHIASKSPTHSVFLGSTPPLFATTLRPGFPAAFATRQDVDACLWLQQYNSCKPDDWSLHHEGNLHAFGYVQASKTQKKFMDCSPDLNYALICESHRHLFLYKSNNDTAEGLRNRSGPQVTLGKQHLITLENYGEVLGVATAPSVVTLLTENNILYLQII